MNNEKLTKNEILKILFMIVTTIVVEVVFYYIGDYFGYRAHLLVPGFIDKLIPRTTYFIYPYIYWYVMLIKVPLVLGIKDDKLFKKYLNSVYISLVIALIIFIVYPTIMEREVLTINTFSDKLLSLVHIVSTPTKCIPSMHVVLSTLFIFSTNYSNKLSKTYKIIITIISVLIIISTLFTKQHYFIDVITGILVATVSWIIGNIITKKFNN